MTQPENRPQPTAASETAPLHTVAALERTGKRKVRVRLEDGGSFVLYEGERARFGIEEGEDLPDEVLQEICAEILIPRARRRCLHLLEAMDRTARQLREKMQHDGYPDEVIEDALAYAASYHYIDDRRYAENYVRTESARRSRRQMMAELERKGVDRDTIREVLDARRELVESGSYAYADPEGSRAFAVPEGNHAFATPESGRAFDVQGRSHVFAASENGTEETEDPEIAAIRYWIRRKDYREAEADDGDRRRFYAFLQRRGFSLEDIRRAVRESPR